MNGTSERVYSRIQAGKNGFGFVCPVCLGIIPVSGDSQNYGAVRRHLNVHVKRALITEQQKVEIVKSAVI